MIAQEFYFLSFFFLPEWRDCQVIKWRKCDHVEWFQLWREHHNVSALFFLSFEYWESNLATSSLDSHFRGLHSRMSVNA